MYNIGNKTETAEQLWAGCVSGDLMIRLAAEVGVDDLLVANALCDCIEASSKLWQDNTPSRIVAAIRNWKQTDKEDREKDDEIMSIQQSQFQSRSKVSGIASSFAHAAADNALGCIYMSNMFRRNIFVVDAEMAIINTACAAVYANENKNYKNITTTPIYGASLQQSAEIIRSYIGWETVGLCFIRNYLARKY